MSLKSRHDCNVFYPAAVVLCMYSRADWISRLLWFFRFSTGWFCCTNMLKADNNGFVRNLLFRWDVGMLFVVIKTSGSSPLWLICISGRLYLPIHCAHQQPSSLYSYYVLAGIYIINLGKTWEKLQLAARVIVAIENPQDIIVQSARPDRKSVV